MRQTRLQVDRQRAGETAISAASAQPCNRRGMSPGVLDGPTQTDVAIALDAKTTMLGLPHAAVSRLQASHRQPQKPDSALDAQEPEKNGAAGNVHLRVRRTVPDEAGPLVVEPESAESTRLVAW